MENTEKQHLELIAEMISSARKEFSDDSYIYLLWGWAVCIAAITQYVLVQMHSNYNGLAWLLMPLAAIVQLVASFIKKRKERVRSHMDKVIGYVWIAFGICLVIVLFSQDVMQLSTLPVLMLLYGIGTFISGGIMRHKPMIAGAICCWVLGAISFRLAKEQQLLLLALSVVLSYIIPGHMLQNRFKKNV
jgi:hypothetical protein